MGKRMMVAAAVLAMLAVAAPGRAETPVEKRLRVLEQQLHEAQDEIKRLRGQVEQQRAVGQATQRQVEQNAEETKTTNVNIAEPNVINTVLAASGLRAERHAIKSSMA